MKVWCGVGLSDTWKRPQLEQIGQWHMLKFKRLLAGQWPKKLPGYTLMTESVDAAPYPYPLYDPFFAEDGTNFFEEGDDEDDDVVD